MIYWLTLLLLTSCSTLKDEECQNRNWRQQGFYDGQKGYSSQMYETYIKVCNQSDQPTNRNEYLLGHKEGAIKYCTFNKGLLVGESGRTYPDVCPASEFPEFSKGFKKGKKKAL